MAFQTAHAFGILLIALGEPTKAWARMGSTLETVATPPSDSERAADWWTWRGKLEKVCAAAAKAFDDDPEMVISLIASCESYLQAGKLSTAEEKRTRELWPLFARSLIHLIKVGENGIYGGAELPLVAAERLSQAAQTDLAVEALWLAPLDFRMGMARVREQEASRAAQEDIDAAVADLRGRWEKAVAGQAPRDIPKDDLVTLAAFAEVSFFLAKHTPASTLARQIAVKVAGEYLEMFDSKGWERLGVKDLAESLDKHLTLALETQSPQFIIEQVTRLRSIHRALPKAIREDPVLVVQAKDFNFRLSREWARTGNVAMGREVFETIIYSDKRMGEMDEAFLKEMTSSLSDRLLTDEGAGLRAALAWRARAAKASGSDTQAQILGEALDVVCKAGGGALNQFIEWRLATTLLASKADEEMKKQVARRYQRMARMFFDQPSDRVAGQQALHLEVRAASYLFSIKEKAAASKGLADGEVLGYWLLREGEDSASFLYLMATIFRAQTDFAIESGSSQQALGRYLAYGWLLAAIWQREADHVGVQNELADFLDISGAMCAKWWKDSAAQDGDFSNLKMLAMVRWILYQRLQAVAQTSNLRSVQKNRELLSKWEAKTAAEHRALVGEGNIRFAESPREIARWARSGAESNNLLVEYLFIAEAASLWAVTASPDDSETQWQHAMLLNLTERPGQAIAPAARACELQPNNFDYLNTHAIVLENAGRTDDARECYELLIKMVKGSGLPPEKIAVYLSNYQKFINRVNSQRLEEN